jgi:uridine kinase
MFMSANKFIPISPALPALPVTFTPGQSDEFEVTCAPLSFFWLARCFNISGNENKKAALKMRIQHLTRLYDFPDDLFEQLVAFGDNKNIDWSPRVPEIVGVRALQRQLNLSEEEYRILAFAFLSTHSRFIGALKDFLAHTFCDDSQIDVISRLIGFDRTSFAQLTNNDSTIVQMHLTGPAPYSLCMSPCDRFEMHEDVAKRVQYAKSVDDDILSGLLVASSPAKLSLDDYQHVGEQLTLIKKCVAAATGENGRPLSLLIVGMPGSGKTQLAKALCADAGANLYEVPVIDEDSTAKRNNAYRLGEFVRMSNMLKQTPSSHILFDEVEDVLNETENKEKRKGWINQTLERRDATTYWICNDIKQFDNAFLRRFDFVVNMPSLDYRSRVRMLTNAFSAKGVGMQQIYALASQRVQTPAKIEQLAGLANRVANKDMSADDVLSICYPTLSTWHSEEIGHFDLANCRADTPISLKKLTELCTLSFGIRVLVNGAQGSGKTSLARFLCFECNESTHYYDAMSLITPDANMFFGLITSAFNRANTSGEMLVIDGIDHLLTSALRTMPNPDSFYHWLADTIRAFRQPLVLTANDIKALQDYPIIAATLDVNVRLQPWSSSALQTRVDWFAQKHGLESQTIHPASNATPQVLINALRRCRLHEDMRHVHTMLNTQHGNSIGFLASVS